MADIQGLLNSGATLQDILAVLYQDLEEQINTSKGETKTLYQEAMKSIEDFYKQASIERGESFQERYNLLNDNLANLGMNLSGDLANQWDIDTRYLTEAADTALATDLAWFEKLAPQQQAILDAILTEAAAQMAMTQIAGTGGGGGYGSGGGGGYSSGGSGGSSSNSGDWKNQTSLTVDSDYERTFPGFVEQLYSDYGQGRWSDDQWAYINDLVDVYEEPKDMLKEIVQDTEMATRAEEAANRLLAMLSSGSGGTVNQPLPVGDGTFTWQNTTIPSINEIEDIELVDRQNLGALSQEASRRMLAEQNPYVTSLERLDEVARSNSARTAFDEVLSSRNLMGNQARDTIAESQYFRDMVEDPRQLLRYFDPLRGWVNTDQSADEWWRASNTENNQPAPSPIVPLDVNAARANAQQANKEAQERTYWETRQGITGLEEASSNIRDRHRSARDRQVRLAQQAAAREEAERAAWAQRAAQMKLQAAQKPKPASHTKPKKKKPTGITGLGANSYR